MTVKLQEADLFRSDGSVERVRVPAFPNHPEAIRTPDGQVFVADSPVIGYGTTALSYHHVVVWDSAGDTVEVLMDDNSWIAARVLKRGTGSGDHGDGWLLVKERGLQWWVKPGEWRR